MTRLVRRMFPRVFDRPRRAPAVRRAADLRVRLLLQPLEGRVVPTAYTVNATTDTGTGTGTTGDLRYCINQANASPGADTIAFDATVFGTAKTITLASGQLNITDAVTITGT